MINNICTKKVKETNTKDISFKIKKDKNIFYQHCYYYYESSR
jgi:hypothetical protein